MPVPDLASIVKMVLALLLTTKTSGNATLGDPSLNAFQPSNALNLFTKFGINLKKL